MTHLIDESTNESNQAQCDVYQQLKYMAREERSYHNEVRQFAWRCANPRTPGSWPFWRHGFLSRFGRRVERSGYTGIPNYDGIAQQVGWEFPEFATDEGTDRLWDMLLTPYNRLPSRDELMSQARAILEDQTCE